MSFVQDVGLNLWKQTRMASRIHMMDAFYIVRPVPLNTGLKQADPTKSIIITDADLFDDGTIYR